MKNLENDLNVVYSLDKSRAVDKKYLDDYFYNKIKRDNEKIASVYIIDELIQSFFRDYTLDIYNLEKPIESNESLLKEYPNNKPVYQMLLSGWFTKKDILSYIEDSDKGIELFRNFKNVTDVSGYYKYTREMNAIYKSFSNIETIQDFLYACSKYALYRLLGDIAVCHYLGLRKDFNTSMFQSDGVDPSFERMVKPYKLHHKTMWYTELNKNIKGIVYPEMSKEWVFKDEAPWLDSYLENVYDKPLLLVLVVKTYHGHMVVQMH